jgi:endo-1,4-beta-D-glucanase Y
VYSGSATGADLNMAMALFQAECQWGGGEYFAGATRLIDSIRTNATKRADGRTVLLPTDGIAQSDSPCSNPSYYSPAFYRVFAKAVPAEASFWNGFADDSYELLESASASATHLAPDWAANSSDVCPSEDGYVGYDGIRTIWRVATDYNWFGTEEAKAWLDDVNGYMTQNVGAARLLEVKDGFFADGAGMLTTPGTANSAFVGAFAVGTLAADQKTSDEFHEVFADIPRSNDTSYYAVTMRAVFMLLSAGRFSPGCY